MGSGKTTLGKGLASLLKRPFVDLDSYIEDKEQASVADIFENKGEEYFRRQESLSLAELLDAGEPTVIALGGGTACSDKNLEKILRSSALLLYLELPVAALAERLRDRTKERPLLKSTAPEDLEKFIEEKLGSRKKYYTRAHLIVNGINLTPELLLQQIIAAAKKNIP